jgi:hypothetical protein
MVLITASTISEWTRAKGYRGRNNIGGSSSRTRLRLGRGEIGGVICCMTLMSAGGGCGLCKWQIVEQEGIYQQQTSVTTATGQGYKAWRYISGHEKTLAQNLRSHGKSDISTNSSPQILFPGSKLISKPSPSFRKEKLHSSKFPCVDVVVFAAVFFGGARVG